MSSSVANAGDRSETLLTCCGPNLEFDSFSILFDSVDFEVNTNGADVEKTLDASRSINTRITNEQKLEQIVTWWMIRPMRKSGRNGRDVVNAWINVSPSRDLKTSQGR